MHEFAEDGIDFSETLMMRDQLVRRTARERERVCLCFTCRLQEAGVAVLRVGSQSISDTKTQADIVFSWRRGCENWHAEKGGSVVWPDKVYAV